MIGRRTVAAFLATSVLFGGTFVAAKAGLAHFPPLLFVALRFDVAAVALFAFVALTRSREQLVPRTRGDLGGIVATGLFAIGLTNALLFVGQQYVTSGVGAIIASLNPILTPVFAAVLLADERLSARGAVGMALGLLGVGLVASPDPAALLSGGVFGEAVLLVSAVCGALGSVLIRRADADLDSTVRVAWGLPLAALVTHALSLGAGESVAAVSWNAEALLALGYVAVFAGALAYIAYFGLIDSVGAIRANLAFYVVPLVATLGGWALLGETISGLAVAGFLVVFAGFAVIGSESFARPGLRDTLPGRLLASESLRSLDDAYATDGGTDAPDDRSATDHPVSDCRIDPDGPGCPADD
ncbi:DMT family transporter [Halosimplex rubrum]|uniref:DMT family transporter n=1 Tax=Halosimplex rubrum TaxID=869889 RepID=A0A7D5P7P0_9EURY|nr:DMT family transporter [Halosimplex rubrum]QLH79422.1 DMT family transporter [Halosimplex rubrum]